MAGAVLLGPATKARATLTLEAQETTGSTVVTTLIAQDNTNAGTGSIQNFFGGPNVAATATDTNSAVGTLALGSTTVPITFGDFSVLGSVSLSNSPGDGLAQLMSNSLSVTNNTSVAHTITLIISDTGFTNPTPPIFQAAASGSFNINNGSGATSVSGNSATATAFADFGNGGNNLFGMGVSVLNYSFSTGTTTSTLATYSSAFPPASVFPGQPGPYSMTVELVFTVAGNNNLSSRSDSITAIAPTPEPATLAMVFSALPLLGLAAWRKRRKSA
jgi:hypothetical protein